MPIVVASEAKGEASSRSAFAEASARRASPTVILAVGGEVTRLR